MNKWVLIKKASEMTGYSMSAIYTKIDKGIWPEGKLWRRGPDRRKQINMEEYDRWVESEPIFVKEYKKCEEKALFR
ncbi:hypothetical protein SODG_005656 [Sodalis praecaptivus]|uniref:hypothetical protein n=1 Tax=Sodalis praecaptivus TaxID=1239307 RepID=UPI0027F44173|nr:hypothetical protein [Sodalis praecaptivus]CAJ0993875.1 hypothetical protein NVIRENTERO_01137 [Sodalis praecaptivus]